MLKTKKELEEEILERGVEKIIEKKSLKKKLTSGKKLRIKLGFDPTGTKIHIGRAIQLWKLRQFQELGHQIVFIIGDFTAQIGDASDKTSMRKPLTEKEIKENMRGYKRQIGKILDLKKTEIHYNSEWFKKLKLKDIISLAMHFTAQQMIQRRNFKERWEKGNPIGVHELLYPILQGYDSLQVKADVEIGGYDQLFNLKVGREIQRMFHQSPQDIMVLKMLYGTDGRKMSTSWGNVITIEDKPSDMYGKIMSMKDELIGDYLELCTTLPLSEIAELKRKIKKGKINPRDAKAYLAREIVSLYWGKEKAQGAEEEFERVFKKRGLPEEMPVFESTQDEIEIVELMVKSGIIHSKSKAKRIIEEGGVKIVEKDGEKRIKNWKEKINLSKGGIVIKIGKRKFLKVKKVA